MLAHLSAFVKGRPLSFVLALYVLIALYYLHNKRFYAQAPTTYLVHYDAMGYYAYLCLWWSDEAPTFERLRSLPHSTFTVEVSTASGDTLPLNKYSTGVALLYTPFFWMGDGVAYAQGLPRDGLSMPYLYSIQLGAIAYAVLALLLLGAWLRRFCGAEATAVALLATSLGTLWWQYVFYSPLMAHHAAFVLFAALLYGSGRWYETGAWRWVVWLGLCTGLLAATRLPDLIVGWVILLGGVGSRTEWKQRVSFLWQHQTQLLLALGLVALVQIPQMLYWYEATGQWWINAYADNGEGFFWGQPRLGEILIGYRKGWLIYTPMAFLCLGGLYFLYKNQFRWFWAVLGYLLLQLYLVSTWGCWWYGGSFGLRPMTETMAVLTLPLALLWEGLRQRGGWRPYLLGGTLLFFIVLNQFQSHQLQYGIVLWSGMTRQAYWHAFGVIPPADDAFYTQQQVLLQVPDNLAESRREVRASTIW